MRRGLARTSRKGIRSVSDILSQEEIDALLGAVASGQVKVGDTESLILEKGVSAPYDFRRPKLISKEQMRALQMLSDTFAKSFAGTLSLSLRTTVNATLALVEQFTYSEFITSLPNPTCLSLFSMEPLEGLATLEINPVLVFVIVDRLLGGRGQPPKQFREFTEIENRVILTVIHTALEKFQETWKQVAEVRCVLEERASNPQFSQVTSLGENVLLITLNVEIAEHTGMVSLCLPIAMLTPVLGQLNARKWIASAQPNPDADGRCRGLLEETEVELEAVLGGARMTLNELLNLQRGDVVVLDGHANDAIMLHIGNTPKFYAKPGLVAGRYGVEVVRAFE